MASVTTPNGIELYADDPDAYAMGGGGPESADLLAMTTIRLNWDVQWFMVGDQCLHAPEAVAATYRSPSNPDPGWDGRSDLLLDFPGLVALPFLVGRSAVLGIVGVRPAQRLYENLVVLDGTRHKEQAPDGYSVNYVPEPGLTFPSTTVSILMNSFDPRDPDPLFPNDAQARTVANCVIKAALDGIANLLLEHGSEGFSAVKPQLDGWLDTIRLEYAEQLRGA
ncbi:MAG: hypothetical protein KDC39_11885 [Actinobacteria bacterium]|nr:hypothetical protein [Actinomycetota bacterium]